jgi:hypothetical protein
MFAIVALLSLPLHLLFIKRPIHFFRNCWKVLTGSKTWIGYLGSAKGLPQLRAGIVSPNGPHHFITQSLPPESLEQLDQWYARDYEITQDLRAIIKNYRLLGS